MSAYVSAIHQAVVDQNAEALFRAGHALNSSSAMIVAMGVSSILKDFEQLRMTELDTVYEAVRQAVLGELGEKTA